MVPEEMLSTSLSNKVTRRYPWEIQQLVSTQELPHKSNGEGVLQTNSNPNCQVLTKFHFGRGVYSRPTQIQSAKPWPNFYFRGGGGTPDQLKSKVSSPDQIFIFRGEGRYSRPTQILSPSTWPNFHPGGGGFIPDQLQIQSAKSWRNVHFRQLMGEWGGGIGEVRGAKGYSRPTFLKYLSGGAQRNFEPKILVTGMW